MLALIYRCIDPNPATRPTATECVELLRQASDKMPDNLLPLAGSGGVLPSPFAAGSAAPSAHDSPSASHAPSAAGSAGGEQQQQQQGQQGQQQALPPCGRSPWPARDSSALPPRFRTRSMQATLEEEIVEEALAELHSGSNPMMSDSRLRVRAEGAGSAGGGFRRHSTRLPQPADSKGRNVLTRRMVLTTSASLNSPFRRPPLPPGARSPADNGQLLEDEGQQSQQQEGQQSQQQRQGDQPQQQEGQQQQPESPAGEAPPRKHRRHRNRSVACTPPAAAAQQQQQATVRSIVSPFQQRRERDSGAPPFQPAQQPPGEGA